VERTKGKKYRPVLLNKRAREILLEVGDKLFAGLNKGMVTHKFNDIMKRVGLTQFKLHSLRHTFATRLVSAGVDIYAVKELLGHQDIRTSMVYAKANTDTLRNAVERLKN
jgi:site-specific recombinase XerD